MHNPGTNVFMCVSRSCGEIIKKQIRRIFFFNPTRYGSLQFISRLCILYTSYYRFNIVLECFRKSIIPTNVIFFFSDGCNQIHRSDETSSMYFKLKKIIIFSGIIEVFHSELDEIKNRVATINI